jgi:hypothetical protein
MQLTKEGEVKIAYNIALWFTILGALFISLSPQYFGFVFSVIFIVPIYMAIKSLKNRRKSGLYLSLGIVPLSISLSSVWIRYIITVVSSGDITGSAGTSPTIFYIFSILSIIMTISCIVLIIKIVKYRKLFNS